MTHKLQTHLFAVINAILLALSITLVQIIQLFIYPFSKVPFISKPAFRLLIFLNTLPQYALVGLFEPKKWNIYTTQETFKKLGSENSVALINHRYTCDFLYLLQIAFLLDKVGHFFTLAKSSLKFAPVIGPMMLFQPTIFLKRSLQKDKANIQQQLKSLKERYSKTNNKTFTLGFYPEGTRFTDEKLALSNHLAKNKLSLPKNKYLLHARPSGFQLIHDELSKEVSYYVILLRIRTDKLRQESGPSFFDTFSKSNSECFDVHIKRYSPADINDILEDHGGSEKPKFAAINQIWQHAETRMENYEQTKIFPDERFIGKEARRPRFIHNTMKLMGLFLAREIVTYFSIKTLLGMMIGMCFGIAMVLKSMNPALSSKKTFKKEE